MAFLVTNVEGVFLFRFIRIVSNGDSEPFSGLSHLNNCVHKRLLLLQGVYISQVKPVNANHDKWLETRNNTINLQPVGL